MTQLTGLHAKFTGDASGLAGAAQQAIGLVDQYGRALQKTVTAQDASAATSKKLALEFHKLKMETDGAFAGMQRFQKASELVTKVARDQKWSVEQLQTELTQLANHYGVAEAAGLSLNQQVRSARFHTANLAAQFNDIGVMLASGQSPFILAIQQGTQVSQVLNSMGGTAKQQFAVLGQSLLSIINPTSLLTVGLIAGTAALYQWGMGALGAGTNTLSFKDSVTEAQAAIDELNRVTKLYSSDGLVELERKYGEVNLAILALLENQRLLALADATEKLRTSLSAITSELGSGIFSTAYGELESAFEVSANEAQVLYGIIERIGTLDTVEKQIASIGRLKARLSDATDGFTDMNSEQLKMLRLLTQAEDNARQLAAAAPKGDWMNAAIDGVGRLGAAIRARIGEASRLATIANAPGMTTGNADWAKNSLGFTLPGNELLPPVPAGSGGGGGGGGGGAKENPLIAEIEQLRVSLLTQEQLEAESYAKRQELIEQAWQQRLITEEQYQAMLKQVNAAHQHAVYKDMSEGVQNTLSALGSLFQGSKKIGAGIALANSWLAFTEVLKDPAYVGRPWARFAAAASALASGLNAVKNINSATPGGGGGGASAGAANSGTGSSVTEMRTANINFYGGFQPTASTISMIANGLNDWLGDGGRLNVGTR